MQHHADKAVFSAIFRQTPTDPSAVNMHDDEEEEEWSEGSGEVSEEPSAAHWAAQA